MSACSRAGGGSRAKTAGSMSSSMRARLAPMLSSAAPSSAMTAAMDCARSVRVRYLRVLAFQRLRRFASQWVSQRCRRPVTGEPHSMQVPVVLLGPYGRRATSPCYRSGRRVAKRSADRAEGDDVIGCLPVRGPWPAWIRAHVCGTRRNRGKRRVRRPHCQGRGRSLGQRGCRARLPAGRGHALRRGWCRRGRRRLCRG